jgi:hypothetical protein
MGWRNRAGPFFFGGPTMSKTLSNSDRQRLTDRAAMLSLELSRLPRRGIGGLQWQCLARTLLACERRLRLQRLQQYLDDEREQTVV